MLSTAVNVIPRFRDNIKTAIEIRDQSLPADSILSSLPPTNLVDVTGVPRACGLLSEWELHITEDYDAVDLVGLLKAQKVTSLALVKAFRKRASIAQQLVNCVTELVPEALEWAEAADEHIRRTGQPLGPLHGLPISLKEQISVSGRRTNASFVAWTDNITKDDASLVKSLKLLGAVVFARTSQPQSLMHLETSNNIYGVTVNPKNRLLSSGGSSGGEAALMALRGTPLGFGGDIGGSIRSPAAVNGLWGFKPSTGRYSGHGVAVATPGCDAIHGTLGPFARTLRDLDLVQSAYSSLKPWLEHPDLLPCPVSISNAATLGRKLRVGIMTTDEVVRPLPPVQVVIDGVAKKLAASPNIEVVSYIPLQHDKAWQIISANYLEDGGEKLQELCAESGEGLRPLTSWFIDECKKNELVISSSAQGRRAARDAFRHLYSAHWNAADIDVVVAPATPNVAPLLDTSQYWTYTAIWNLLDYPAISFPASEMIGGYTRNLKDMVYAPTNEMEEFLLKSYDPDVAQKMPVGLQVVSKKWMDSECMAAAKTIEEALRQ